MATTATPTFSLSTGVYEGNQTLSISCATPSSTIFFTTDGTVPTHSAGSPTGTTGAYTTPFPVSQTEVVIAIGYLNGNTDSPTASVVIGIVTPATGVNSSLTAQQASYLQQLLQERLNDGDLTNPFSGSEAQLAQDTLAALRIG